MVKWGKKEAMPEYSPTKEEMGWYLYCVRHNIKISPGGIIGSNLWTIDVNTNGTWHKSPSKYNRDSIWVGYYKICKYYYDKRK